MRVVLCRLALAGDASCWDCRYTGNQISLPGKSATVETALFTWPSGISEEGRSQDLQMLHLCTSQAGLALRTSTEALPGLMVFFKATVSLPPCVCTVLEICFLQEYSSFTFVLFIHSKGTVPSSGNSTALHGASLLSNSSSSCKQKHSEQWAFRPGMSLSLRGRQFQGCDPAAGQSSGLGMSQLAPLQCL